MIVGDLLTVKGRSPDADMELLREQGLELHSQLHDQSQRIPIILKKQ